MAQLNSTSTNLQIQDHGFNDIVSTDQLLDAIEYSKNMVNPMEIKNQVNIDSVIIQGFSGVGKSSMILTLSGQPIIAYHHHKTGVPTLATRDPAGKKGVRIEEKIFGGTIYPVCSEITKEVAKEGDIVMLWDMPGIGQNRGLTQSLINSYYYTRIFELQHSIKIVFAINHTDLDFSLKGINIQRSFTDFLKMFGQITPFQRSILFVITKAPIHFTSQNAVECFKDVLQLPYVRNNKSIQQFVEKLSSGKIPIVIFHYPNFNGQSVNSQSPVQVAQQYTKFAKEFYSAVKTLKPTREIKLNAPAMSTTQRDKCSAFVNSTQTLINNDSAQLCTSLEMYLKQYFLANIEGNKIIRSAINSISFMRDFVKKFTDLISISGSLKKEELKTLIDKLHNHLISNQRKPFCVLGVDQKIHCYLMENLANNLIMVNFLNILCFHKQPKHASIDQIQVMKALFKRLKDLNLAGKWNIYEEAFKKRFGKVIVDLYEEHLNLWETSQIYFHWRNNFRFFPSLVLRSSKFIKSKKQNGSFALNYFKEVAKVEQSVSLKSQTLQEIKDLLQYNKKLLNFDLQETVMTSKILPMLDRKQKNLIQKVISYDKWQQQVVEQSISQYKQPLRNNPYLYCNYSMSSPPKEKQKNTCPTNQENEEDNQSSASLHFDLLTLHDRKGSYDSDLPSVRESQSCYPDDCKEREKGKKGKRIQKKERDGEADRRTNLNKKRRIYHLENRVEELEREVASLRRNEHYYCLCCRSRLPEFCRQRLETTIQPQESAASVAGDPDGKKGSKDSLQFEKIDFNAPLVQSQEMEEKLWIFVGTILIAMGSKVADFDGTINIFKVLKQSVDRIRRQVEKSEPKIGLQFFCCKEEMNEPQNFIDGMIFDPFYSQKHETSLGHFSLDGIKLESVEQQELFYDSKYHFRIKYDALLSIIEFARDNCSIS